MTYKELIKHYGTPAAAAAARKLDRQIVHGWKTRGRIPLDQQVEYEIATEGQLKADLPNGFRERAA